MRFFTRECVFFSSPPTNWQLFYTWVFYTLHVFSPSQACGFLHENFFYRVRFFLQPPHQLVVFYTWASLHNARFFSLPGMFFTRIFLQSAFFLQPPHQLVVFYTWVLLHNALFSPSPTCGFYTRVFTECVFLLVPPPIGSFLHLAFTQPTIFSLPYV